MQVANMTHEPLANDPGTIWRNQRVDRQTMSVQQMQEKVNRLQAKKRRKSFIFYAAFCLYFGISIGALLTSAQANAADVGWVGLVRFGLLIVWVLGLRYYVADRPMSLGLNTGSSGLDFYRRELLIQYDYFRDTYRWLPGLLWVVLFFITTVISDRRLTIPLSIILAIFVGLWYRQWRRGLPALQREIEALDALKKENQS